MGVMHSECMENLKKAEGVYPKCCAGCKIADCPRRKPECSRRNLCGKCPNYDKCPPVNSCI